MKAKSSHGFSLVELMVALVISSILLGGVMTVMSSSKRTYTLQSEFSALQDNARFLIDELTYKIRMAGYKGCLANPLRDNPFVLSENDLGDDPVSDELTIVSFGEILPVQAIIGNDPLTLNLGGVILPYSLLADPTVYISGCGMDKPENHSVTISNNSENIILTSNRPLERIIGGMEVFNGLQKTVYRVQVGETGLPGLYRCQIKCTDADGNGQCDNSDSCSPFELLVDGVQSMQVRYGIQSGAGIQFVPETTNLNDRVVAVRINLLMRTPQRRGIPSTTNKVFYLDPEVTYNPYDHLENEEGFRHRLFMTTIQVRNSIIN